MKNDKRTKTNSVLSHLKEFGNITSWEAIKEYGATRLSAIIYVLRHKYGLHIDTEMFKFKDRYGNTAEFARYIYKEEEDE